MNLNFNRLLLLLLPTFLRKEVTKSFLSAIAVALQHCKTDIDTFFRDINYHVRVTPQTFSLEKMLNDKCDRRFRRIRIEHPAPEPPFYFTTNESGVMEYFGSDEEPQYFMGKSDYSYDFGVYVPRELRSPDMDNIITALLNKYKIITKSFLIFYV
jgi:hypothetical protein